MSNLDELLRESLGRLAEPGDPTGVLEAIRARVDAAGPSGDGGSGAGGTGGWGSAPWAGPALLGAVALVAAASGVGLALAAPEPTAPAAPSPVVIRTEAGVDAAACPGGPAVTTLDPGARVLALARSEDGGFLAVRDPASLGTTVWVSADAAAVDSGQDVGSLPVASCEEGAPIPVEDTVDPVPVETTEAPQDDDNPAPKPPAPAPPADTTPPTIQVGSFSPDEITDQGNTLACPESADVTIVAADNSGSVSVSASTNRAGVTASQISHSGTTWVFRVTATGQAMGSFTTATVSFTASDPSSNTASGSTIVDVWGPDMCVV